MNRKGLAPITIILLVILGVVVIGAGTFFYVNRISNLAASASPTNNTSSTVATSGEPIVPGNGVPTPTSTTPTPPAITTSTATLTPQSGPVGTVVTIHGSGFAATGNTVTINGMVSTDLKDLASNGNTITFTFPSSLGPNCKPNQACPQFLIIVTARDYTVAVILPTGATQSIGIFTVTGGTHVPM